MRVAIITTYAHKVFSARKELLNELLKLNHEVIVMGPEEEELSQSAQKELGIKYIQINIKRYNLNLYKELLALNDIKIKLKSNQIDCVLVYGIRMIPSVVLAAKLANVKRIVSVINGSGNLLMIDGIKGKIVQTISFPMLWIALRKTNTVIFQNTDDYKEFKQKRLISKDNAFITNGSGVNIEFYNQTPLPEKLSFLLISRITGSKGINEYVHAATRVKAKFPEAQFALVGPKDDNDGSVDWGLITKAEEEGILHYYGESSDVREHIKKCRIYVFPSYYREGVPRSVLEAMSMGRPIITTDSPGCRETVIDGVNGFLVPPRNIDVLVKKMIWMIENPKQVNIMAKESRRMAVQKFDVNKVNVEIIKELS